MFHLSHRILNVCFDEEKKQRGEKYSDSVLKIDVDPWGGGDGGGVLLVVLVLFPVLLIFPEKKTTI